MPSSSCLPPHGLNILAAMVFCASFIIIREGKIAGSLYQKIQNFLRYLQLLSHWPEYWGNNITLGKEILTGRVLPNTTEIFLVKQEGKTGIM